MRRPFHTCTLILTLLVASLSGQLAIGAAEPPKDRGAAFSEEDRNYWALQPLRRPDVPQVSNSAWPRNAIDAFILARLQAAGLAPAPEAGKVTLIRRATFDLHGLPPAPEEVDRFLADTAPDAYPRLIERLLASPRYGERWARHWLDLVRFAESDGFKADDPRPDAWRYRDWVIRSLNDDKPYDRFVAEQLAGDEMFPGDPDALVATGFLRHWPYEYNQAHVRQQWENILNDVTDVSGQVFLGLTVGCARCHDHKFDPILRRDYYALQAFFAPLQPRDEVPVADQQQIEAYRERQRQWEEATAELRAVIRQIAEPYREKVIAPRMGRFPKDIQDIIRKPAQKRTPLEQQLAALAKKQLVAEPSEMAARMQPELRKHWEQLRKQLAEEEKDRPKPVPVAMTVGDVGPDAPPVYIPGTGDTEPIEPGFLTVLDQADLAQRPMPGTGRRAELARWITSPDNPLTARVMVNRIWQYHFDRGLVPTANDFGRQGEANSHPQLLDWLASEFVARGWSIKEMHRLMMNSATYRQSSTPMPGRAGGVSPPVTSESESTVAGTSAPTGRLTPAAHHAADPDNRLLHRMRARRLQSEELRDAILATTGELNPQMGGPSVYPDLPEGFIATYTWNVTKDPAARNRRSIYVFVKRNLRFPLFDAFDMPDTHESCARRNVTTTAPQALLLVNGSWTLDRAAAFAGRLLREAGTEKVKLITHAYRIAFSRNPDELEIAAAERFLEDQSTVVADRLATAEPVALPPRLPETADRAQAAALVDFCHVLLNSNEFIYVD